MSRSVSSFAIAVLLMTAAAAVAAVEPSGTTVAVDPSAAAAGATGQRTLEVMGPVFMGDRVDTGAAGQAQIKFRDDTRLVVGPNSSIVIDKFVFNDNATVQNVSMQAAKGAFRFITGTGRKQAYSISTPAATIGIRGTRFDFFVRPSGETFVAMFEGQARVCDRNGRCSTLRGGCSLLVAQPSGGLQGVTAGPRAAAVIDAYFPYVAGQSRLRPDFRVNTASCETVAQRPLTPRRLLPPQQPQQAPQRADTGGVERELASSRSASPN